MWGETGRLVHRKIEHTEGNADASLKDVFEQLAADRAAITQIYEAVQAVGRVVNKHNDNISALDGRLEEQTRMRLDDHRLHIGAVTHVRTGVESLESNYQKLMSHVDTQDKAVYTEIEAKLQTIQGKVDETVSQIVGATLLSSQGALDATRSTDAEMKSYIVELEKACPE